MWGFLFGVVLTGLIVYFRPDTVSSFMSCVL